MLFRSKSITRALSGAVYAQGYLFFVRDGNLLFQPFDPSMLQLSGSPATMAQGLTLYTGDVRVRAFAASETGLLLYSSEDNSTRDSLVWKDRAGRSIATVGEPTRFGNIDLSPDAKALATTRLDLNTWDVHLWLYDLGRGLPVRFSFARGISREPIWSPDGKYI